MNKDNLKLNWKVAMRKIKQQWGDASTDDLSVLQKSFEDYEWQIQKQHRLQQVHAKALKN